MSQLIDELKTLESHMKALQEELKATKEKLAAAERKEQEAQQKEAERKEQEAQQKEAERKAQEAQREAQKQEASKKILPDPTLPQDVIEACNMQDDIQTVGKHIQQYGLRVGYRAIRYVWSSSSNYNETILNIIKEQDKKLGIFIINETKNWFKQILTLDTFTGCDIIDLVLLHGNEFLTDSMLKKLESTEVLDYMISKNCDELQNLILTVMNTCQLTFEYYMKLGQLLKEPRWPVRSKNFMRVIIEADVPYKKVAEFWKDKSIRPLYGVSKTEKTFFQKYPDLVKHFSEVPLQIAYNIVTSGTALEFKEGRGKEFMKSLAEKIGKREHKLYFCVSFGLPIDLDVDSQTLQSELTKEYCELNEAMKSPEKLKAYLD